MTNPAPANRCGVLVLSAATGGLLQSGNPVTGDFEHSGASRRVVPGIQLAVVGSHVDTRDVDARTLGRGLANLETGDDGPDRGLLLSVDPLEREHNGLVAQRHLCTSQVGHRLQQIDARSILDGVLANSCDGGHSVTHFLSCQPRVDVVVSIKISIDHLAYTRNISEGYYI